MLEHVIFQGYFGHFTGCLSLHLLDLIILLLLILSSGPFTMCFRKVELQNSTEDDEYLRLVKRHVPEALQEFPADLIVYNAGTDILSGDPLGKLKVSPEGIKERDRFVFEAVRSKNIPIVMLTSGGFQRSNARIVADSLISLHNHKLIDSLPNASVLL